MGSNPYSDFHTGIQTQKMIFQSTKASFKSSVFQQSSGFDKTVFWDKKKLSKIFHIEYLCMHDIFRKAVTHRQCIALQ